MPSTSPIAHRAQKKQRMRAQHGTILSFTTLQHPPAPFDARPRTIGLIELEDGSKVFGEVSGTPSIGKLVQPRMRLSHVNEEKLRIYDIAYEVMTTVREPKTVAPFPGYILALTGPTGVGKTTVGRVLISVVKDYAAQVPMVTTIPRTGDAPEERYLSRGVFADLMQKKELVAFARHPSDPDEWYGYRKSDIDAIRARGLLPVVVTDLHLLQGLRDTFGRRSILSFGLLPPGTSKRARLSHLLHRLRQGGYAANQLKALIKRAEQELLSVQKHTHLIDHLLINEDLETVVATLRKHAPGLA